MPRLRMRLVSLDDPLQGLKLNYQTEKGLRFMLVITVTVGTVARIGVIMFYWRQHSLAATPLWVVQDLARAMTRRGRAPMVRLKVSLIGCGALARRS